jgi:hypothetical protein
MYTLRVGARLRDFASHLSYTESNLTEVMLLTLYQRKDNKMFRITS